MNKADIRRIRLYNQQLSHHALGTPTEVVGWLGAVQSQDYAGAKWALGQRLDDAKESDIEEPNISGDILRTHVLRPTWHFVTAEDIRWILELSGPRVQSANAYYYRQSGLDAQIFARTDAVFEKALRGGKHLTRTELAALLEQAGILAEGIKLSYIMMRAELDGVICSGARRGNRFTYAMLDERAPHAKSLPRDEALAELVWRYFRSHGPATVQDFVWWSGLTASDTRAGIGMLGTRLTREIVDGQEHWFTGDVPAAGNGEPVAYLLPNYDEYGVSYKDRSALLDRSHTDVSSEEGSAMLSYLVFIDGQYVGSWKRSVKKSEVLIETKYDVALSEAETEAVAVAAERYGRYLGVTAKLV